MNSMKIPSKRSTLEKKLDKLILTLFTVLFCMCLLGSIGRFAQYPSYFSYRSLLLCTCTFSKICNVLSVDVFSGIFINRKYYYLRFDSSEAQFDPDSRFVVNSYYLLLFFF